MDNLINNKIINGIADPIIGILIALSLVYFLYNMATYLMTNDSKKQSEAKNGIIYGIIFLFVSVSVWGFVRVLEYEFLLGDPGGSPSYKEINVDSLRKKPAKNN